MGFNQGQEEAIGHKNGPMIVLAGPGSGKTLVITHRTKHLIEEGGIHPSNILVITFTRAAANEMKERFETLTENAGYPVTFGTFHAVFFKILKFAYHLRGENILREEMKYEYIREIIEQEELEIEDQNEFIMGILSEISMVKGDMIDLNHYYSKNCSEEVFKKIFNQYSNKLERAGLLDFDDMLVKCYELLRARPDILKIWQDKYKYILIDEFQDINKIQYEIIKMLAKPENNLFIVGDDDQSVYRFRGARPEIMLNFHIDFPDTKKVLLDINYRSTKEIISSARKVIQINNKRFEKAIVTENGQGSPVEIKEFKDTTEELKHTLEQIKLYIGKGFTYRDMAFLFRTNIGPRQLVEKLMEYNIPFRMKDNLPNMYEHWIAKDILTYIRIAGGSIARNDYLRIMNKPKRYLSRMAFPNTSVSIDELKQIYGDKEWMIERIDKLEYDIGFIKGISPYSGINYIRSAIGYDEYLDEYAKYRRMKVDELYNLLDELVESAKPFKTYEEWFEYIEEYSQKLKEQVRLRNLDTNSMEIATMHSAKGLEYPIVFLLDVNEGITPHNKAVLDEDMEEERRLFYVALTRAKENIHVYTIKEKHAKPLSASRFIGEMRFDTQLLVEGAYIIHRRYGEGKIKKINCGKMDIYFPKLKKLMTFDIKFAISNGIVSMKED